MVKRNRQKGNVCSVDGCEAPAVSRGWCNKHNMAMHRYGSVWGKSAITKVCANVDCQKDFPTKREATKYCSTDCYRKTPEYREAQRKAVERWRKKKDLIKRAKALKAEADG